jgi:hypothetical protein
MGMSWPVAGFAAYAPVNSPVFSFVVLRETRSCLAARARYSATSPCCCGVVIASTSGCSGASTRYVAPKIVSGRVVKTSITGSSTRVSDPETRAPASARASSTRKRSRAPSERPIQFRCACFVVSDQSSVLEVAEQPRGVVGDAEEPLLEQPLLDHRAAPLAGAALDLLVGEHGLAAGAPVHGRLLLVRQSLLVELQEDPLRPLVVVGSVVSTDFVQSTMRPARSSWRRKLAMLLGMSCIGCFPTFSA